MHHNIELKSMKKVLGRTLLLKFEYGNDTSFFFSINIWLNK